jgi:hypothetical protein
LYACRLFAIFVLLIFAFVSCLLRMNTFFKIPDLNTQTNNVKDLPRSGRPRVTSDRDDRALQRLVRRMPFATSPVLKQNWLPNRRLSIRPPVRNRLKSDGFELVVLLTDVYIGQPILFEYGTGCEWHPSNQTLQCSVVTIRCYPWSAGSWQVFHIVGSCVFSHQSADYSIVVAHLTSNSFEGHPC